MNKELKKLEELLANDRKIIEDNYKEIVRLKELCNKYEEEHKTTFEEWKKTINIINELEKYCNEEIEDYDKHINSKFITDIAREQYEGEKVCFEDMLGKLQELKGSSNNE